MSNCYLCQARLSQYNIRRFQCYVSPPGNGTAHICNSKRCRIVDAVTNHQNPFSCSLKLIYKACFVSRRHLTESPCHPNLVRYEQGCLLPVATQQYAFDFKLLEVVYEVKSIIPQLVTQYHNPQIPA